MEEHKQSTVAKFEKFTWKVENFSCLEAEEVYSEPFILCGYQWRISLFPRGNKLNKVDDNLSIYLEAVQTSNMSEGWNRDVIFRLSVFNQLNTNMTITKESSNEFNATEESLGFESFMTFTELHDPKKGFIVKDSCVVGAEVFVSNSIPEKPISEAANLTSSITLERLSGFTEVIDPTLKLEEFGDVMLEKFTWKLENFSRMSVAFYSKPFVLGGYLWKFLLFKSGDKVGDLYFLLSAVETANISKEWSRHVKFRLLVFNQLDSTKTIITDETEQVFTASNNGWGIGPLVSSNVFYDPLSGFLIKDVCIIGIEFSLCESKHELQEVEVIRAKQEDCQGQNQSELMDFNGLGQIEKAFVPLLEQACSLHHSLIVSQQKRSREFREWAFSALGRVLYFLNTKKVKDMNDIGCNNLQIFWEELEHFGFDLTWLEPHVHSALGMKSYLKKLKEAEKLKDNVVALKLEMQRLKEKMATARRELLEAQDFEEIDLNAELGFVKP